MSLVMNQWKQTTGSAWGLVSQWLYCRLTPETQPFLPPWVSWLPTLC